MTFSGIGEPGQRETTRAGLETGYSLVVRQVKAAILLGWLVIFLVLACIFVFALKYKAVATYQWVRDNWPYLTVPFVLWAFVPSGFGVWRFIAEIADPTYPTPRSPVPELQRDGPRWPWTPEPLVYEDDEPVPPQRTVRVEVITNGGKTHQYGDVPDLPGLPMFARVVLGGKSFSHRTARMCSIKRPQFEDLARTFRDKGWAAWRDPSHTKQGTELLVVGRAVLKDLATPTLMEVKDES